MILMSPATPAINGINWLVDRIIFTPVIEFQVKVSSIAMTDHQRFPTVITIIEIRLFTHIRLCTHQCVHDEALTNI